MVNPTYLSNLSYTNKDFQSIYVELLDLVKKLTYRWDPSTSNESDPGVLLIKLMAICTDKTNYTSDKNVLECFPESVVHDAVVSFRIHDYLDAVEGRRIYLLIHCTTIYHGI